MAKTLASTSDYLRCASLSVGVQLCHIIDPDQMSDQR